MSLDVLTWDWIVRAGSNVATLFRVPERGSSEWADLTGSEIRCWIRWDGGEIALASGQAVEIGGLDYGLWLEDQGDPDWRGFFGIRLTLGQSRMLPSGMAHARYDIEQWIEGEQRGLFTGRVIVMGGVNRDE
jgi:hypothetical protein